MLFKSIFALAAFATASQAALTAMNIVDNINNITDVSANTDKIAMNISPRTLFRDPPRVINNFRTIITIVSTDIQEMNREPAPRFPESDQNAICASFRDFVKVHQALLRTMIGKHGLLAQTPFTAPIGQVLRVLEGGVDTIAFGLIDLVPTCAKRATEDKDALDKTLIEAMKVYDS